MAERIRISLCGPLTVTRDGEQLTGHQLGSRKSRALLALLAVECGTLVTSDRIADVLWSEDAPAHPSANLATLVSRLRRLLGEDVVIGDRAGYRLADAAVIVDLDAAEELVEEALARLESEPGTAAAAASRALETLVGGDPVPEEPAADWPEVARRRAVEVRRTARHVLAAASTASGEPERAVRIALEGVTGDPYDERAHRDLMRALSSDGRSAAALEVHGELAARLRDELGVDPDERTDALRLAILRQDQTSPEPGIAGTGRTVRPALIGRDAELSRLEAAWSAATAGSCSLALVVGEAGSGKTRLMSATADLATRTGGRVLTTRCHAGESSLFLQPFVDLLRPLFLGEPPRRLLELLRPHAAAWATLVPDLQVTLGVEPAPPGAADFERRRAYDAVTSLVRTLQLRQPLLIAVDDVQDAGAATLDLLAFLVRHVGPGRVLILVAARAEALSAVARLAGVGDRIEVGPLPGSAVHALATQAGLAEHAPRVLARTAGHALSVVESLRAIAEGDVGVPATLADAIMARVDRLDDDARHGLEAAAVLGTRVVPQDLCGLLDEAELATLDRCRTLVDSRLLVVQGSAFEFGNDLVQETVLASLSPPRARAYHRQAANVLVARPEAMAAHAERAGDIERAALGWLLGGEDALRRSAVEDAQALFDRALRAASDAGRSDLTARALLARARALELLTDYDAAMLDINGALELARKAGNTRLEMTAELAQGGDVAVALGRPLTECGHHLEAGLHLATRLGDRAAEAELNARLTVLEASRLQLAGALHRATDSLARARASGDEDALVPALDGFKNVNSYLADADALATSTAELIPMLRRRGDMFLLQWAVFESSLVPASRGDWAAARTLVDEALELNRRSGYVAYTGYLRAHRGWLARLAGDLPAALEEGRRSLAETSRPDHPWWYAGAAGLYAASLLAAGQPDEAAEVAALPDSGSALDRPEAFRLRCLAPLAAATGQEASLHEATRILDELTAPPGRAWLLGADTYLDTATAWVNAGDPERARQVLAPLRRATRGTGWQVLRTRVDQLQNRSASS